MAVTLGEKGKLKKELTVIIPAYNDILHLDRMLKSLQEAPHNEIATIFIINDNDNIEDSEYKKLINKYDMDIKYYRNKENIGVGATRKRGIELSVTDWIAFVDQDDYVVKNYFRNFIMANKDNDENKLMYAFLFKRKFLEHDDYTGLPTETEKDKIEIEHHVHIGANFYNKLLFKKFNIEWLDDRMSDDLYMNALIYFLNKKYNFVKDYEILNYTWDNTNTKSITNTTHARDISYHLIETFRKVRLFFEKYCYDNNIDENEKNNIFKKIDENIEFMRIRNIKYKFPEIWYQYMDNIVEQYEKSFNYVKGILTDKHDNFIHYMAKKYLIVYMYDELHNLELCSFIYELYYKVPKKCDVDSIEYERTLLKKMGIK